jgi:hypothetical protein
MLVTPALSSQGRRVPSLRPACTQDPVSKKYFFKKEEKRVRCEEEEYT